LGGPCRFYGLPPCARTAEVLLLVLPGWTFGRELDSGPTGFAEARPSARKRIVRLTMRPGVTAAATDRHLNALGGAPYLAFPMSLKIDWKRPLDLPARFRPAIILALVGILSPFSPPVPRSR